MKDIEFEPAAVPTSYLTLRRDAVIAFTLWLISMLLLGLGDAESGILVFWGLLIPYAILLYCYSCYSLIPSSLGKLRPIRSYLAKVVIVLMVMLVPVGLLVLAMLHNGEAAIGFNAFNAAFQLLVTTPIAWRVFKRRSRNTAELHELKTELGQSTANLDFLRSQINPHFLFNALNTLYGTALQEKSERTAQGIQMLGDMMRFMLHENHQTKILLSRELEYMRNYIDLQSLRTATSPNITIQTKIDEVLDERSIAPMLLIPFVENAFKHGISLKEPSWIKITLHSEQDKLYFDVYNSTHVKPESELAKDTSGIGLDNVRQRLALLYPEKHELVIRETVEEYFVHLTLQL